MLFETKHPPSLLQIELKTNSVRTRYSSYTLGSVSLRAGASASIARYIRPIAAQL